MSVDGFKYSTRVSFYDTDAMGVMHHAAYLKKFEDARVAWLRNSGLDQFHYPKVDMVLAVIHAEIKYHHPSFFEDQLSINLNISKSRLKLKIDYVIEHENGLKIATGQTTHVPLGKDLKLVDYPEGLIKLLQKESING